MLDSLGRIKVKPVLGPRQWLCWCWPGLTLNQRRDVLRVMTSDKSLSLAHRRTARRKLTEK
jgi:hypothetical protein